MRAILILATIFLAVFLPSKYTLYILIGTSALHIFLLYSETYIENISTLFTEVFVIFLFSILIEGLITDYSARIFDWTNILATTGGATLTGIAYLIKHYRSE